MPRYCARVSFTQEYAFEFEADNDDIADEVARQTVDQEGFTDTAECRDATSEVWDVELNPNPER